MSEKLGLIICFGLILVLFLDYWFYGLPLQERNECLKWINESQIYPGYYFTDWQKEQCLNYGYDLEKQICIKK